MLCCVKNLLSLTTVGRCSFKSFTVSPTENIKYLQKLEFRFTLITSVDTSEGFRLMVDGRNDDFSQKYYFATHYRVERS